jgi:hypothetical protein
MNLRVKILAKLTATDVARSLRSVSVPTYLWCRDGLVSVIKPHLPAGGSRKVLERNGISQRYVITAKGSKWLLGSLIKHVGS